MPRTALAVVALALALPARADRRETYAVIGYEPGVSRYQLGKTGSGEATRPAGTLTATVYYGLTNSLHLGGRLGVSSTSNLHIGGSVVSLNGVPTQGDVYEDALSIGFGGVAIYRIDTHHALAPLLELEGGFRNHQFSRVAFIPSGSTYVYSQESVSTTSLYGAAALLLEYRFATRWIAAAGIAGTRESGPVPWGISVPLRVGVVW